MTGPALHTTPIADLHDPRLADYAGLREAYRREQARTADAAASDAGLFIAEGELVLHQLVGSRFAVRSVLLAHHRLTAVAQDLARLDPAVPVYTVDQHLMNELVGFNIHRGVLASGVRGPSLDPRTLAASARTLIILEDLANHDNVGGIFRNVAGLAGPLAPAAVLLSPRCADPLYRKAIRVSMGHALRIPFAVLNPWPDGLRDLHQAGFTTLALTPDPAATDIREIAGRRYLQPPRFALLLGAEGPGLSRPALAAASRLVRIAMTPGVDSLNVTVAAALALHRLADAG